MAAESAGGIAAILKIYGIKAVLGMVGAALLYIVLPPRNADGGGRSCWPRSPPG